VPTGFASARAAETVTW